MVMLKYYGRRYLTSSEFTKHCKTLHVELDSDDRELELYHKEGVLLPVAEVHRPDAYVAARKAADELHGWRQHELLEWHELERLLFGSNDVPDRLGAALWHQFD